jgi:hypothetical protein
MATKTLTMEDGIKKLKTVLNEQDYAALLKQVQITKELFIRGGAISSVGCSCKPWINCVTFYIDCPFHEEVIAKAKEIDPQLNVRFTDGWKKSMTPEDCDDNFRACISPVVLS